MSIPKWLQIAHDQVFSCGAFVVSEVMPMIDFDKSSGENQPSKRPTVKPARQCGRSKCLTAIRPRRSAAER